MLPSYGTREVVTCVNLCTGKARGSRGNHIRTVCLGNNNMDAKRSLVLLLAFYYYFWNKTPCTGPRDKMTKVTIYIKIKNLSTLTGPMLASPCLKTSANTSQLVNLELSDKFD